MHAPGSVDRSGILRHQRPSVHSGESVWIAGGFDWKVLGPGNALNIPDSILHGLNITHCSIMPSPPKPARPQQQSPYVLVPQQDDFDRAMDLFMKLASMSFQDFPPDLTTALYRP
ncbi:hypothetical protein DE4585_03843 [Mycobacteroides salmoniphilum]|uniref:Uncharacterized protein n=1 Tax=Mycobacteroides salmoniphilum TaxID=404941 RepID=A0A4R8S712_9MYCO|nr:hypothetical protein DE4585_03843 [Mycobacteroides salmoniphilum]